MAAIPWIGIVADAAPTLTNYARGSDEKVVSCGLEIVASTARGSCDSLNHAQPPNYRTISNVNNEYVRNVRSLCSSLRNGAACTQT